jgi:hypothetical protein
LAIVEGCAGQSGKLAAERINGFRFTILPQAGSAIGACKNCHPPQAGYAIYACQNCHPPACPGDLVIRQKLFMITLEVFSITLGAFIITLGEFIITLGCFIALKYSDRWECYSILEFSPLPKMKNYSNLAPDLVMISTLSGSYLVYSESIQQV